MKTKMKKRRKLSEQGKNNEVVGREGRDSKRMRKNEKKSGERGRKKEEKKKKEVKKKGRRRKKRGVDWNG